MPSPDLGRAHERVKLPRHITPKLSSGYYREALRPVIRERT
jgi:hypothetical protein